MTFSPLFTLTPQQPEFSRDPGEAGAPGVTAFVNFWNMAALAWGGAGDTRPTLETQLDEGWVYMSGGTAAPYDEDADEICNRERSQIVEIAFQGINVHGRSKFLIGVSLHALGEHALVRLALNRRILRTEHLQAGDNTLWELVDGPGDRAWVYLDLKHVKMPDGRASAYAFKSATGYLL